MKGSGSNLIRSLNRDALILGLQSVTISTIS